MKKINCIFIFLSFIIAFASCQKDPSVPGKDYFPVSKNNVWNFSGTLYLYDSTIYSDYDTIEYKITKDTLVNGKTYALLSCPEFMLKKGIRKQNGNYYSINLGNPFFQKEIIILKDYEPIGSSWEEILPDSIEKHIYTITAKSIDKTVKGKLYKDVIEVEERLLRKNGNTFYPPLILKHSYANGIGEIYAYYPYPTFMHYADESFELIDFKVE